MAHFVLRLMYRDWMQARQVTESAPTVRSWRRNLFKALRQGSCGNSEVWKQVSLPSHVGPLRDGSLSQELREDGREEEVSGRVRCMDSTGEVASGGTESSNRRDANGRVDGWIENTPDTTLENEGAAQAVANPGTPTVIIATAATEPACPTAPCGRARLASMARSGGAGPDRV